MVSEITLLMKKLNKRGSFMKKFLIASIVLMFTGSVFAEDLWSGTFALESDCADQVAAVDGATGYVYGNAGGTCQINGVGPRTNTAATSQLGNAEFSGGNGSQEKSITRGKQKRLLRKKHGKISF